MMNTGAHSELFQHYPLLATLPADELNDLLASAIGISPPEGAVIFDENQPCQGFPLVISGAVRVIKASPNGRELQLYRVLPGESCILTSSCLLGHTRYQARGIAESNLHMLLLPAQAFHKLLAQHDAFRNYVFSLFSERLTDLMQLVSAVAFQKLDQRLANLIVAKGTSVHTTHQALADELGSVREIISRLLKGFAEQGWVKLGREHIDVTNAEALKKFAAL